MKLKLSMENKDLENLSCRNKFGSYVNDFIERIFYRHGVFVASHPLPVLGISLLFCLLCSLGFLNIHLESRPEKLWLPQNSDFVRSLEWQREHFPDKVRLEMAIFYADNVLEPQHIRKMLHLKERIERITVSDSSGRNRSTEQLCYRVPALGGRHMRQLKMLKKGIFGNSAENQKNFDWSQKISRNLYCDAFQVLPTSCLVQSILDIWAFNGTTIESLTQDDVLRGINTATESGTFAFPLNFTSLLGGVERNSSGQIVRAQSCLQIWHMEDARASKKAEAQKNLPTGLSEMIDEDLHIWETKFIETFDKKNEVDPTPGLSMVPLASHSFLDVGARTIRGDIFFIAVGSFMLVLYVFLMLGRFNWVETRPVLTVLGIFSILFSILMSFGICAGAGIIYGPIHSILPLLLLGLGVDDMFVIVQSLENIDHNSSENHTTTKLKEKMGKVLSTAGKAITVTSLTDFLAFGIGSLTALPALQSFCIYAAVGIVSVYLMQITFFFAVLVLDQTRMEANRNGFLWCVKHGHRTPNSCSQKNYGQIFFHEIYAKILLKQTSKICVIVFTMVLTSFCIWGTSNLKQDFKIIWFIPSSSYVATFMSKLDVFYPEAGITGNIYIDSLDLPRELPKVKWLEQRMESSKWVSSIDTWYQPLVQYTLKSTGIDLEMDSVSSEMFSNLFAQFLFSPKGAKYQPSLFFNQTLDCKGRAPKIKTAKFSFQHTIIEDRDQQIEAMEEVKRLVKNANFSGEVRGTAFLYSSWETNKLIVKEVMQNLSLALTAVFFMTFILIVDITASLLVFMCVTLTLIDVMALMTWWGLTVETVTCINLVLCVGLSVDYSAHVAIHFMKVQGSKDERVAITLKEIGPAVFNGAFSTFLPVVLLANSDSHVFQSFFKIFFGACVYGTYHGLVFLPVLLSFIGPRPYVQIKTKTQKPPPEEEVQLNTPKII